MSKAEIANLNLAISKAVAAIRPPEELTVSQWADKKRKLSPEASAEAGGWRTSRTPYLRDIMDCFSDPAVRYITVVASSQVGKSEAINNMIGYIIDQDPGSILFIQPTNIDAKEYSKLRIAPMIRDCKDLRRKVAPSKSRDSANTVLQKSYPGGILTMCGSGEAHALCSKPIKYVFGDERDRWETDAGGEGDPWSLATTRQLTFYNSKAVEVSTPTVKDHSAIEASYLMGTQERWESMCPHCGEYSEITFDTIRFEYNEQKNGGTSVFEITEIYYVCPKCGGICGEYEIKSQPAKWVAKNPDALRLYGRRSFWLTSWVSPWASWESTILKYLQALGDTKKMQVVWNTLFGKLWEHREDLKDEEGMLERREEYKAELPDGVLYLTCGVDTQDNRLEYEVVGYGHFGESWGIKKGIIMGRPDSEEVWQMLDDVVDKVYTFENGKGLRISLTFVDEGGHFTQEVRHQCRKRQNKRVFAIKGRGGDSIPYTSPPKSQKITQGNRNYGTCLVFEIGVDAGKQIIMDNLKVETPGAKYCHFPKRDDYGAAYFKGLLSEKLVYNDKLTKNKWQWVKLPGHERNEPLDCRNYANAAVRAFSPDFDAIERRLKEAKKVDDIAPRTEKNGSVAIRTTKKSPGSGVRDRLYNDW